MAEPLPSDLPVDLHGDLHIDEFDRELQRSRRAPPTARRKLMDLLARRPHSEFELREKLKTRYEESAVEAAIAEARERGWLLPEADLAAQVAAELQRKNKSWNWIAHFLRAKGLPPIPKDLDIEIEKALRWVRSKRRLADLEDPSALHRRLAQRGFDDETITATITATMNSVSEEQKLKAPKSDQ